MKKVLAFSLGLIFVLTLAFSAMAVLQKVTPVKVPNITVTYIVQFESFGKPCVGKNYWLVTKNNKLIPALKVTDSQGITSFSALSVDELLGARPSYTPKSDNTILGMCWRFKTKPVPGILIKLDCSNLLKDG